MTGYPELNFPAFRAAAITVKTAGFDPVSPLDLALNEEAEDNGGTDRHLYLREDFRLVLDCDGIVLLDGWLESIGANAELAVARMLGLHVYRLIGADVRLSGSYPRTSALSEAMQVPYRVTV